MLVKMPQPSASAVHTESTSGFRCSTCNAVMKDWKGGSRCDECKVEKHGGSHDQQSHGNWARGGSQADVDEYTGRKLGVPQGSKKTPQQRRAELKPKYDAGTLSSAETKEWIDLDLQVGDAARRIREDVKATESGSRRKEDADNAAASARMRRKPDVRKSGFSCTACGAGMDDWQNGSTCGCLTKATEQPAAAAKPTSATAKPGQAGKVQEEFPACPSCGTPTPDGNICEDCRQNRDREHKMGDLTLEQTAAQFEAAKADAEEENERRSIRQRARAAMARMLGLDEDVKKALVQIDGMPPVVLKSSNEKRFSYAPMYMPSTLDAHDEFVKSADELQEAAWAYVEKTAGNRDVYLQHIDRPAGKWVEITSWPYAVEAPMRMPGGVVRKASLPAGTVYMGVIWEPWSWEMVKKGKLLGFSMGGWAKRVEAELATDVTKAVHPDTGNGEDWTVAGVVNPDSPARNARLKPYDRAATARALGLGDADPFASQRR